MVELRKRKEAPPAAAQTPSRKKSKPSQPSNQAASSKPTKPSTYSSKTSPPSSTAPNTLIAQAKTELLPTPSTPKLNSTLPQSTLSIPTTTHAGHSTTLHTLLSASDTGIILFTYPRASTPGCTTQATLFRDSYVPLTSSGLSIYGLSTDSSKSNSNFKTKQNLPFDLLCDPQSKLIKALGFSKAGNKTARGVIGLAKGVYEGTEFGEVMAWEQGGPQRTVEVVKEAVGAMDGKRKRDVPGKKEVGEREDGEQAEALVDNSEEEGEEAKV